MPEDNKGYIAVDLDGTLAEYNGWKGPRHIGQPIKSTLKRVRKALDDGKDIRIFTARAAPGDGSKTSIEAVKKWCKKHLGQELPVIYKKDRDMIELWDDRAVRVSKNTGHKRRGNMRTELEKESFLKGYTDKQADIVDDRQKRVRELQSDIKEDKEGNIIDPAADTVYSDYPYDRGRVVNFNSVMRELEEEGLLEKESESPRHILLTGVPGAGKTTEAPIIADKEGLPYISGDRLKNLPHNKYPGTEELRRKLRQYKNPRVIEGVQILGLSPEELKNHKIIVMDPSVRELHKRLKKRGYTDSYGVEHKGLRSRKNIKELTEEFQRILDKFKEKAPHAEYKKDNS